MNRRLNGATVITGTVFENDVTLSTCMKKITILISSLLVVTLNAGYSTLNRDENHLEWQNDYALRWEDFKGQPSADDFGDAATAIRISAKPRKVNGKLNYQVKTIFIRDQSWYRKKSERLLRHEQLHFDIAEIYARKIRRKVKEYNRLGVTDYRVYNRAIQLILAESDAADRKYDRETLHGAVLKQQIKWEYTIRRELVETNR